MELSVENKPLFMYKGEEPMDESEKFLLGDRNIQDSLFTSKDKASLILIENASEVARRCVFDQNLLQTWGLQISKHFGTRWVGILDNNMAKTRTAKKKTLKVGDFGLIHNHLDDSHFGAFIVEENSIVIYDSMSSIDNSMVFYEGLKKYYDYDESIQFYVREHPFQETGGFYGYLSANDMEISKTLNQKDYQKFVEKRTNESEESQNHFCYMWALFTTILHFKNLDPNADYGNPLVLIKRFMYSLLADKKIQKKPLFDKWFLTYWKTVDPSNPKTHYRVEKIKKPPATSNIIEAFDNSLDF